MSRHTFDEIAARFGVCRRAIQDSHDRAVLKLFAAAKAELDEGELEAVTWFLRRCRKRGRRKVRGTMKGMVR